MKATIDLDKLLEEGKISKAEYEKLCTLSARNTAAYAFNILVSFGMIAVVWAVLVLVPVPTTAIALGLSICTVGIAIDNAQKTYWKLLANICVAVGALLLGGGIIMAGEGAVSSFLLVAVAFVGAGIYLRRALLIVLAVLALSSCLGVRTAYMNAGYFLGVEEPAETVVLFAILSIVAYQSSKHFSAEYQRLFIAAARTCIFLVNVGFWVGSLWGDRFEKNGIVINQSMFAAVWAIALIAAGVWAWKQNSRWLMNLVAIFGGLHFYTQCFERLGPSADSVLVAGLLALVFSVGLAALNAKMRSET